MTVEHKYNENVCYGDDEPVECDDDDIPNTDLVINPSSQVLISIIWSDAGKTGLTAENQDGKCMGKRGFRKRKS